MEQVTQTQTRARNVSMALAYERARKTSEIGLGALALPGAVQKTRGVGILAALGAIVGGGGRGGPVVAPPPTSPYWHPVGNSGAFWAASLMQPAFRAAYNASKEALTQGARGPILWRTWTYGGVWYATSRPNVAAMPQLFQFRAPAGAAGAGKPTIPLAGCATCPQRGAGCTGCSACPQGQAGVGDVQSRIAPYLDDYGMLDADSFGYDLGVGTAPTLDLSRWAAIPTTPAANSPNWRALSATELASLQATRGWPEAVATAQSHGQRSFKFGRSWYRIRGSSFEVLGGGSGSGGHRYLAGVSRSYSLGATKPNFLTPTSGQWSANPVSDTTANAAVALLTYFSQNGVPWEGTQVAVVGAFQSAYNSETAVQALNSNDALLDVDQKYGPNTRAALQSIIDAGGGGTSAPGVNYTAPQGPSPAPGPTPTPTTAPADYTVPIIVGSVVAGAALIGGSWWLATQQKKKGRAAYA